VSVQSSARLIIKGAHLDSGGEASKRRLGEISAPSVRKFCLLSLDSALRTPRLDASAVAKGRTQGEQTMTIRRRLLIAAAAILLAGGVHVQRAAAVVKARYVGFVTANDVRPGERSSGSLLLFPGAIGGNSGVHVEKAKVDLDEDQPRKAVLKMLVVGAGGEKRPADQNFVFDVPPDAKSIHVVLSRGDQQVAAVDIPIKASTNGPVTCGGDEWTYGTEQDGSPSRFRTPKTYCYAGMEVIASDAAGFSGDAAQTRIEAGGDTARNVAESLRYCYFLLPRKVDPGRNKIVLHEGTHVVTFDVFVPRLDLLQVLEDEGATAAEASPPAAAAKSDRPSSPFPFGLGFGIGGGGDNGGNQEPGIGWEHRPLH
jgi:hypothetical protein